MSVEDDNKGREKRKGFAGLSALVTDIHAPDTAGKAKQPAQKKQAANVAARPILDLKEGKVSLRPATPVQFTARVAPSRKPFEGLGTIISNDQTPKPSGGVSGKMIWLTVAVLAVIAVAIRAMSNEPASGSLPSNTKRVEVAPVKPPVPSQSIIVPSAKTSPSANVSKREVTNLSESQLNVPQPVVRSARAPETRGWRPSEEKPPPGRDLILSDAQLRYCVAEAVRVDASRSVVSNESEWEVALFNEFVSDYNMRCGQFRYPSGALEIARSEMRPYSAELRAEGRVRMDR